MRWVRLYIATSPRSPNERHGRVGFEPRSCYSQASNQYTTLSLISLITLGIAEGCRDKGSPTLGSPVEDHPHTLTYISIFSTSFPKTMNFFYFSCKEYKNLNSFFAIIMGLSNVAVSRLTMTWEVNAYYYLVLPILTLIPAFNLVAEFFEAYIASAPAAGIQSIAEVPGRSFCLPSGDFYLNH